MREWKDAYGDSLMGFIDEAWNEVQMYWAAAERRKLGPKL